MGKCQFRATTHNFHWGEKGAADFQFIIPVPVGTPSPVTVTTRMVYSLRLQNCLKPSCETVAGWRVDSTYEFYDKSSICLNRIPSHLSFPPKYQHSWEFTTIPNLPDIAGASSHAAPATVQTVQQPLPPAISAPTTENTKVTVTPHAPLGKTTHR